MKSKKKIRFMWLGIYVLVLLAIFPVVALAVPEMINYQGYLTDAGGNPMNGEVALTFRIYSEENSGAVVWNESHAGVMVIDGVFNVVLGSFVPISSEILDGECYLGITVGTDSEMTPRMKLTSAAYSIRAGYAESVADGSVTTSALSDISVTESKIASSAVSSAKLASGSVTSAKVATGAVSSDKIASGAVSSDKIASGAVSSDKIATGAVSSAKLASPSVTADKIATGAVTASHLQDGTALAEILDDDGSGSDLDADRLDGLDSTAFASSAHNHDASYWKLWGNSGTNPSTNFIGTTDNQGLAFRVNNQLAMRILPDSTSPNLIGGHPTNWVTAGVYGATIGGGGESELFNDVNRVTDHYGTIGGGKNNQAGDNAGTVGDSGNATVGGGDSNTASNNYTTVGGGYLNTAGGDLATVGGGHYNRAIDYAATAGGGASNTASNWYATVGGGENNGASGFSSTVPGGFYNNAYGDYSFAAGSRAKAFNQGCFVWADSTGLDLNCTNNNRFVTRASGGYKLFTDSNMSTFAWLAPGASTWSEASDRNVKENYLPTDGKKILISLASIPITTWNYKSQDPSIRHMGPVAQDFSAAFGLGESDKRINTIDVDGVALAAIQGLYKVVQEKEGRISTLEERNLKLEARLATLESLVQIMAKEKEGGKQ